MSEVAADAGSSQPQAGNHRVVVQGGDSPLLFDDLTSSFSQATKEAKAAKEPKKTETDKKVEKDTKELTPNDDTVKAKPKAEETGKKEAKKLEESKDKEEAVKRKTYKAKWDKTDYELDEDAEFEHAVNGQPTKVKLKELLSDYSGRKDWSKKYQDLSVEKKSLGQLKSELAQANEQYKAIFGEQDPTIRMFKLAEKSGIDPVQFRQKYLDDNIKLLEKWSTMSEDERKADTLAFENQYLKYQADTKSKFEAERQATQQRQAKINELLTSHKMSQDEFEEQAESLNSIWKEYKRDPSEITPEMIVESRIKDKLWLAAEPILAQMETKLSPEQMKKLVDTAFINQVSLEELPDVLDFMFGKQKAKQIIEDKQKQAEEFKKGKQPTHNRNMKVASDDVWSFDQM